MKALCLFLLVICPASMARGGAFDELPASSFAAMADLPVPAAAEPERAMPQGAVAACPASMKGDASVPCVISTSKTTVCSDGQKINAAKVTEADVKAGRFDRAELGKYKDADLREWAAHQKRLEKSSKWADGSHQSILATGKVNPLKTAYVVLPNRAWLGRSVTVCVKATGACTEATALEVGPNSTFKDHSEISVRALMDLGLDAHPNSGTYYGEIVFTFH